MDYCLRLEPNTNSKWAQTVSELKVRYTNALAILNLLKAHPDQRIIIYFLDSKILQDMEQKAIIALKAEHNLSNFALCLDEAHIFSKYAGDSKQDWLKLLKMFKEESIPFFFSGFVRDFVTLHYYIDAGVSDVMVTEDICFKLDKVSKICKEKGVKVRVLPNVCQGPLPHGSIYDFFIRPEDIAIYEPYVDVCEFSFRDEQQDTYYKIYAKDKKWFGNLQEIILGLDEVLDSRFIIKQFAEARVRCGKKCFEGNGCRICERCLSLANTLQEHNIIIDHK